MSTTTIVRMSHKLGLEGFSELKYILKTIENQQMLLDDNPVDRYKEEFVTAFEKTLVQAAEKLKYKVVDTAAITNASDSALGKLVKTNLSMTVGRVQFAGYDITARSTLMLLIDLLFENYLKRSVK